MNETRLSQACSDSLSNRYKNIDDYLEADCPESSSAKGLSNKTPSAESTRHQALLNVAKRVRTRNEVTLYLTTIQLKKLNGGFQGQDTAED